MVNFRNAIDALIAKLILIASLQLIMVKLLH